MLKKHLAAPKHGQVTARRRQKKEINLLVWHKYYTDDLGDTNTDISFKTYQVLGSHDLKASFKIDFEDIWT